MSLIPCDYCALRVPEKLAQVTTAWYRADGVRVAYRQRLCVTCVSTNILPFDIDTDYEHLTCPGCGIATDHDMDPVYVTGFFPGGGRRQFEFPTCASCAAQLRIKSQKGAVQLENRPLVEGPGSGPSTGTTRDSYWASIGIGPNTPAA